MKVLAVIPARGGSKRIPRKNIKIFCGKPIIQYSIEAAENSGIFDEIMVSTEDEEIASISKSLGGKVPFLRSAVTADSKANHVDVLAEVIEEYEKRGMMFDSVCFILSTAPFVTPERIKQAYQVLTETKADGVIPVVQFGYPIQRALSIKDNQLTMIWPENILKHSQDLQPSYHDSGQFYWLDVKSFKKQKKFFPKNAASLILPESEVQDIDTEEDWKIAEMKYKILRDIK